MNEHVLRFLSENDDIPLAGEDGVVLRFQAGHRPDSWIDMTLVVDEDTTMDAIRLSWGLIRQWRERLTRYQGRWSLGGDNAFYRDVSFCNDRLGQSYQRIAELINTSIADCLWEYAEYEREFQAASRRFESRLDVYLWRSEHNPWRLAHALDLMRVAGISEKDRHEWVRNGLENLAEDRSPFPPESPVSTRMIRERVRMWRDKRQPES